MPLSITGDEAGELERARKAQEEAEALTAQMRALTAQSGSGLRVTQSTVDMWDAAARERTGEASIPQREAPISTEPSRDPPVPHDPTPPRAPSPPRVPMDTPVNPLLHEPLETGTVVASEEADPSLSPPPAPPRPPDSPPASNAAAAAAAEGGAAAGAGTDENEGPTDAQIAQRVNHRKSTIWSTDNKSKHILKQYNQSLRLVPVRSCWGGGGGR